MTILPALLQVRQLYDSDPSMFKAAGSQAARLSGLGRTMTIAGTVVFIIVMAILLFAMWRRRNEPAVDGPPLPVNETAWVLYGGAAIPALILAGIFFLTLGAFRSSRLPADPALTIEVIGHQWWWEVRYPGQQVETANEIHLPVGQPVKILLRSADVIHSFWVPNLAGKTDVIPGHENATWLEADGAGTWRGECAEYCGMQHAHMALSVVAQPAGDFARWIRNERAAAVAPSDSGVLEGMHTFLNAQCVYCHTVRGTQATGTVGPDLTHFASRLTIASGTLPNTRGNLGGWILNPDRVKPGTKMPAVQLSGGELQAILAYLETLR